MKIQQVQAANNITPFKAHFVNDKNGYFRMLWEREEGVNTKIFKHYLDKFTKNNVGHEIEITELDVDNLNYISERARSKLFNHTNGEWEYFSFSGFDKYHPIRALMKYLTSKNIKDSSFFLENSTESKCYKLLLGKK